VAYANTKENIRLYYEETGQGTPILFVHEFGGDHRSWEAQMRYFGRRYRCIAYNARGYPPSDVPQDAAAYSYRTFLNDAVAMLDHLKIAKAHIVGLSMGGYTALQLGLNHPDRALSLTLAGTGSGSERAYTEEHRKRSLEVAALYESAGAAEVARTYGRGPGRVPFEVKDPLGFARFQQHFSEHDARGSALTMRGFQAVRPSLYDFEAEIRAMTLPALIVVGDEDDPCLEPGLFLKTHIAASGLSVFPKSGHLVNLEEPALFNRTLDDFLSRVDAGRWPTRDPRSMRKKT